MKKHLPSTLAAISCLLVVVCLFQISELKQQVNHLQGNLSNQISSVNSSVSGIYSNVSAILDEQSSLLSAGSWEFGKANMNALTVEVICSVTPKEYTVGTEAAIILDGVEYPMTPVSGGFTVRTNIPLFSEANASKVIFREGDSVRTETLDWYLSARYDYLPIIYADFSGSGSGSPRDGIYTRKFDGVVNVDVKCAQPCEIKSVTLVELMNGEETGRTNIPLDSADFFENYQSKDGGRPEQAAIPVPTDDMSVVGAPQAGPFYYALDKEYQIPYSGRLTLYVEVEDGNGLVYRCVIVREEVSESGEPIDDRHWWGGMEADIYDANGKALLAPDPSLYQ